MKPIFNGSVENLLKTFEQSTAWEIADGKSYYGFQRMKIYNACVSPYRYFEAPQIDAMRGVGAFSALSPNNDEAGNYRDLRTCIDAHFTNVDLPTRCSSYPQNVAKAMRILRGQTWPEEELRGRKTLAFYHNTLDPLDPYWVTIDGHMVSTWLGRRVLLRGQRGLVKSNRESAEIGKKEYEHIATDVRKAAKKVRLVPSQFQSICWLTWKRLHKIRYQPQLTLPLQNLQNHTTV